MVGNSQQVVSLWHFCVVAYGLDGYIGHLLGTMAIRNGFWSCMDHGKMSDVVLWSADAIWIHAALGFSMAAICREFLIGVDAWAGYELCFDTLADRIDSKRGYGSM